MLGCKDVETKKVSSKTFLEEELKTIDMQEVDEYPIFESCEYLESQAEKRTCFEQRLITNFYSYLSDQMLIFNEEVQDTIWVHLVISEKGTPQIEQLEIPSIIMNDAPKMNEWLNNSLDSLPKIYPAIKRGIPVKTAFKIPIVIQAE